MDDSNMTMLTTPMHMGSGGGHQHGGAQDGDAQMVFESSINVLMLVDEWHTQTMWQYCLTLCFVVAVGILYEWLSVLRSNFESTHKIRKQKEREARQHYSKQKAVVHRRLENVNTEHNDNDDNGLIAHDQLELQDVKCDDDDDDDDDDNEEKNEEKNEGHDVSSSSTSSSSFEQFLSPRWRRELIYFVRMLCFMCQIGFGYTLMLIAMTFNVGVFFSLIFGRGIGWFLFVRQSKFAGANIDDHCHQ
jgi:Ctr copper transporter family